MKRYLIFGLLGPPLGFVTGFWIILQAMNWRLGAASTFDYHQIVLIPLAYAFGIVPALVAALFDHALAHFAVRWRILWTTLLSYFLGFVPIINPLVLGHIRGPDWLLLVGLMGAVPGAICSWLSGSTSQNARAVTE
ncbi:MAG TPA: DUF5413 family protein [Pseudolabrys sp.]|jgi:hypothetical protein|nr:DUF5413 family protein [Pseudolabrys sp.]